MNANGIEQRYIERAKKHLPNGAVITSAEKVSEKKNLYGGITERQMIKVTYKYNGKDFFSVMNAFDTTPKKEKKSEEAS